MFCLPFGVCPELVLFRRQETSEVHVRYDRLLGRLAGASGKNIEPESIVVQTPPAKLKMATARPLATRAKEQAPRTNKEPPKSNKQKALKHGEALWMEKLAVKSQSVAATWKERCLEFDKQPSLFKRYLRTEKYASDLSSSNWQIIGAEVLLYLGDVLLRIQSSPQTPKCLGEPRPPRDGSGHI